MSSHHHVSSNNGASHGSLKSYIIGFLLSIIFTLIPFKLVMDHSFTNDILILVVVVFAILQLLIQLIFFLHLSTKSESRWNLMAFLFTILIVAIVVIGSLWIMYNLNYNMMDH